MRKVFVGIDLAIAKKKILPISVCVYESEKLSPIPLMNLSVPHPRGFGNKLSLDQNVVDQYAMDTRAYLCEIEKTFGLSIECIAIDAPSDFKLESLTRREAEKEMDRQHISCFATPSRSEFAVIIEKARRHLIQGGAENRIPHANQLWMLAGFSLFRELQKQYKCIEVFPQAIAHAMGVSAIHKSKKTGYAVQLDALAQLTGWQSPLHLADVLKECGSGASHDRLDAFMSAWVAYLSSVGKAQALGVEPDDVIWIPDIDRKSITVKYKPVHDEIIKPLVGPAVPTRVFGCPCCEKGLVFNLPRICPECRHEFKGIGWGGIDAHWRAHHESNGLTYEQFRESLCDNHR